VVRIQVRYFAVLRERLARDGEALDLPDGANVGAALDALGRRHDVIASLRGKFQTAVNLEMVDAGAALEDGDELALIPPVAGGADRLARMVRDRAPSLDACIAAVKTPDTGGIATFTGCVRRTNQDRAVERLEYEAYDEMANKVLADLCDAIEAEIPGTRLAVEHRAGALAVGDVAVVIAAAAPHRAEAFAACREMIERLKQSVPIWKKEIGPDGDEWIGLGP
jgi:molybdopterin synthase catalytic subunit